MPSAHIILAHPEPQSYNAHLARTAEGVLRAGGWHVTLTDLYAIGFEAAEGPLHFRQRQHRERYDVSTEQRHAFDNGMLPAVVRDEIGRLEAADLLVLQFPLWWYGPPAILKGWFDRVMAYGAVYASKMRFETGKFAGKRAIVSLVGGGEKESFVLGGRNGDVHQSLWPTHYSLHYVGYTVLEPIVAMGVGGWRPDESDATEMERLGRHCEALAAALQQLEQRPVLRFNSQKDWTAEGAPLPGHEDPGPFVHRAGGAPRSPA